MECQTDAFLDRPPTPLFVPAKTGVDNNTQILEGEVITGCSYNSFFDILVELVLKKIDIDLRFHNRTISQLFDFDIEVKPILEVLVGKTIEQALMEVMEEEELANLRAQQVITAVRAIDGKCILLNLNT